MTFPAPWRPRQEPPFLRQINALGGAASNFSPHARQWVAGSASNFRAGLPCAC